MASRRSVIGTDKHQRREGSLEERERAATWGFPLVFWRFEHSQKQTCHVRTTPFTPAKAACSADLKFVKPKLVRLPSSLGAY